MTMETIEKKIRLAAKYDFIYSPFDFNTLRDSLMSLDYIVVTPPSIQNTGQQMDLMPTGDIAKKDDLIVDVSSEKQVIGVRAADEIKVLEEFNKIEEKLLITIGEDLSKKAKFYEIIHDEILRTGKNPTSTFQNISNNNGFVKNMESLLKTPLSFASVKLIPANVSVESTDWFNLVLEPVLSKANSQYHFGLIYRNKDKSSVENELRNLNEKMRSIFDNLENL